MPYSDSGGLPREVSSKMRHFDILNKIFTGDEFKNLETTNSIFANIQWNQITKSRSIFDEIIVADSGPAIVRSKEFPYSQISVANSCLLTLQTNKLYSKEIPNVKELAKYLENNTENITWFTPLRNILKNGLTFSETFREILFNIFLNNSNLLTTLNWLIRFPNSSSVDVKCSSCNALHSFTIKNEIICNCGKDIFVTDYLVLHDDLSEFNSRESIVNEIARHIEVILIFGKIKEFLETDQFDKLENTLFLIDGALNFKAPYNKLLPKIRKLLEYAKNNEIIIHLASQEKTGQFVNYLELIESSTIPDNSYFIPNDSFIRTEIQQVVDTPYAAPYGKHGHYGRKVLYKLDSKNFYVINIAISKITPKPTPKDLIGFDRIISSIEYLQGVRYASSLLPISLAHDRASIARYPSVNILNRAAQSIFEK
jgi:hypothetical protein